MKTYIVTTTTGEVAVDASYVRVDNGHLVFRRDKGVSAYPELLRVFAPGAWAQCQLAEPQT